MLRKFGIDISVYDKSEIIEAYFISVSLILFAGLISLICANFPIVNLSMSPYRIAATILLPLIYAAAYSYYMILHKETLKLYLAAISLGVMASSTLFIISVLYFDLTDIFKNITMLSTFEKWSVLESYFTTYYVQFLPCLIFLFIANVLRISLRGKFIAKEKTSGVFGSAEFADKKYFLNNGFFDSSKSLFGKDDQYLYYPICNRTIVSMSGGGKTTGITIPALLTENRPVFVHDPKGELYAITSKHRMDKFGREIILFDPFGITGSSSKRSSINPFCYFPSDNQNYKDRFITSLTSAIVKSEGSPRYGSHFEDTAKIIIAGIIDMLVAQGEASFLNLYYIISEGPNAIKERIHSYITDNALNPDTLSPHLKEAWAILEATGKEETGSIFTTTLRQIRWLADSNLRGLFKDNTCDLRDFINGKADIFIVLPEDQIKEQSRVVRLILALTASLLIQTDRDKLSCKEYLFLLDELGQLGYNEELENYIEILRGRNCVFWSVFQTYSQIKLYQKPDLFINSKMLQLFSCSDPDIMQLIQKLGGKKTVLLESRSSSDSNNQQKLEYLKGSTSESTGTNTHEAATDLIQLNDIREMPFDEQLVFIQGMKPIKCNKTFYFREEGLRKLC